LAQGTAGVTGRQPLETGRRATWRAPGRVNLIGDHTDYNDGFALPFAISRGVTASATVLAAPVLRIASTSRQPAVETALSALGPGAVTGWAAHAAGVVWALATRAAAGCAAARGAAGVAITLDGDVPIGAGLASSAAVTCATASALNDLWQLGLAGADIVSVARRAENEFVGAPTGARLGLVRVGLGQVGTVQQEHVLHGVSPLDRYEASFPRRPSPIVERVQAGSTARHENSAPAGRPGRWCAGRAPTHRARDPAVWSGSRRAVALSLTAGTGDEAMP